MTTSYDVELTLKMLPVEDLLVRELFLCPSGSRVNVSPLRGDPNLRDWRQHRLVIRSSSVNDPFPLENSPARYLSPLSIVRPKYSSKLRCGCTYSHFQNRTLSRQG
uniref:Uncharacterized protein n=1 Tax=Vitis vinifera TaxID=29760 RepID=A5B1V5_VITVI|nr:hypothetical protein VITISV_001287 [Vitis vinifera]